MLSVNSETCHPSIRRYSKTHLLVSDRCSRHTTTSLVLFNIDVFRFSAQPFPICHMFPPDHFCSLIQSQQLNSFLNGSFVIMCNCWQKIFFNNRIKNVSLKKERFLLLILFLFENCLTIAYPQQTSSLACGHLHKSNIKKKKTLSTDLIFFNMPNSVKLLNSFIVTRRTLRIRVRDQYFVLKCKLRKMRVSNGELKAMLKLKFNEYVKPLLEAKTMSWLSLTYLKDFISFFIQLFSLFFYKF